MIPGCVPVFMEVQACNIANYEYFSTWQDLSPNQQAFHIAQFIANNWIQSHKSDAEYRQMKLKTKSK